MLCALSRTLLQWATKGPRADSSSRDAQGSAVGTAAPGWQRGAASHGLPHGRDITPWHSNAGCPSARRASPRHGGAVSKKHLRSLLKRGVFPREDADKKPSSSSSSQHSFTHGNLLCHAAGIGRSGTARNASRAPRSAHAGRARSCAPFPRSTRRQLPAPEPIPGTTCGPLRFGSRRTASDYTASHICCGAARRRRKRRKARRSGAPGDTRACSPARPAGQYGAGAGTARSLSSHPQPHGGTAAAAAPTAPRGLRASCGSRRCEGGEAARGPRNGPAASVRAPSSPARPRRPWRTGRTPPPARSRRRRGRGRRRRGAGGARPPGSPRAPGGPMAASPPPAQLPIGPAPLPAPLPAPIPAPAPGPPPAPLRPTAARDRAAVPAGAVPAAPCSRAALSRPPRRCPARCPAGPRGPAMPRGHRPSHIATGAARRRRCGPPPRLRPRPALCEAAPAPPASAAPEDGPEDPLRPMRCDAAGRRHRTDPNPPPPPARPRRRRTPGFTPGFTPAAAAVAAR